MIFNKKISQEEYDKEYRPLLVDICRDCISKAKSLQSKYKYIEDPNYVMKDLGVDDDYNDNFEGKLNVYIFEQSYTYFFITIMDGSQNSRCTSGAQKYLKEVRNFLYNKYKSKIVKDDKELIKISTGDGDEGTIYIKFNTKLLGFKYSRVDYKKIKESYNAFEKIIIL